MLDAWQLSKRLFGNYYAFTEHSTSSPPTPLRVNPVSLCVHCLLKGDMTQTEIELFRSLREHLDLQAASDIDPRTLQTRKQPPLWG